MKFITSNNLTYVLSTLKTKNDALYAPKSHGTHLELGTTSTTAYRGDYGNTAYTHSQAAHAPSNAQKNSDITKAEIEAKLTGAITSHTHNYAGSSSAGGAATSANKVNTNLVVKLNSGTTEGTNLFTFNGSAAKTINITPSSIGAAASSHGTHVSYGGNGSATTVSRSDHTHSYLPLSGGTMTGKITTPNNAQGIAIGDDITLCDRNIADHLVLEGSTATNGGITFGSGKDTNIYRGGANLLKTDDTMNAVGGFQWNGQSLDNRYAAASHGTHLTIGTGASNAAAGNHTHNYAGSSSAGGTANSVNGLTLWTGTQAEYNSISSKSTTTLYFIKE